MAKTIYLIIPLVVGYLLDLLLGDPPLWPHPVRLFGLLIEKGEGWLNSSSSKPLPSSTKLLSVSLSLLSSPLFLKGMALTIVLCTGVFVSCNLLSAFLWSANIPLYLVVSSIGVFYGLANRQLILEGRSVFEALQTRGVEAGRFQLSRIVGRDTTHLTPPQIRTAVLETLSENLSDGVIAPLFYYMLAGVPGMLTYKMINTMDSMIGYRSERYEQFGKFAARLDDVVNFIPARLTALLMVVVTFSRRGANFIIRYGHRHKSPNAGFPEAALAGILDLRFGGANIYQGVRIDKPFIGDNKREIQPEEINRVSRINHSTCLLMLALIIVILSFKCISPCISPPYFSLINAGREHA